MWASLRSFDEFARDGVRRAIPLAILMYLVHLDGGCAIALVATCLLWPRDHETEKPVPVTT